MPKNFCWKGRYLVPDLVDPKGFIDFLESTALWFSEYLRP